MKDLLKLYSFESVHDTDDETAIADWICNWLDKHNVEGYQRVGNNIFKFSADAISPVILSAHLDQVKTNGKAVKFYLQGENIVAYNDKWERTSLGADDKNGVWIILKALEAGRDINFFISAGEECGCVGINRLDAEGYLEDIDPIFNICLVLDRKGYQEILKGGSTDTYCSTLAQSLCNYLGREYTVGTGSISDTRVLCQHCESVNMATAYTNAHSSTETTNWVQLQELKEDVIDIIDNFVHYPTPPAIYCKPTYTYTKSNKSTWSKYDDEEWYRYEY